MNRDSDDAKPLSSGTRVEVRNRFDDTWTDGFVVVDHTELGYQLRKRGERTPLAGIIAEADVRREHRRSMWWM